MRFSYLKEKVRYFTLTHKLEKVRKFIYKIERFLTENMPEDYDFKTDYMCMHTDYYIAV